MNQDILIKEGKVFFGKHEVLYYTCEDESRVCKHYAVRVFDGRFWRFATTIDIVGDLIWLCGYYIKGDAERRSMPSALYDRWESVEYLLNTMCAETAGENWAIFRDDDFLNPANFEDDNWG